MLWVPIGRRCPRCGAEVFQDTVTVLTPDGQTRRVDGRRLRCPVGCVISRDFDGQLVAEGPAPHRPVIS